MNSTIHTQRGLTGAIARLLTIAALLAAVICSPARSLAANSGIQDGGAFFSDAARSQASQAITEIVRTRKKDVLVETFREAPAEVRKALTSTDPSAKTLAFDNWARKQAREKAVNGVYILLVREPSHLQIAIGDDTQRSAFTTADRDALAKLMLGKLRQKQFDAALVEGVGFVSTTMASHAPGKQRVATTGTAPAPAPVSGGEKGSSWGILFWVLIIAVVWIGFGLLRSLLGGGAAASPTTGGGGFMRSLMGGLFGAAAGMWIYDQFFSSHSNSAHASDLNNPSATDGNASDGSFSGQDTDYTSSGGDFGSSAGGDWGSGDSGGGDF